ncbi:hypothetical protein [Microbulbifer epialgicus]|uniref:Uncharacterized protein n=1 Tax=Microbulbifer epialgicus TaxID=393907 RepID=A0ABV4NYR4_9GAMM
MNSHQDKASSATCSVIATRESKWLPPLIAEPADCESEDHRRNCLAWHLFRTKTRPEILDWLKKQSTRMANDMRVRLNILREQVREMRQQAQGEG